MPIALSSHNCCAPSRKRHLGVMVGMDNFEMQQLLQENPPHLSSTHTQSVMKRWLPLSEAVLRMVVERGPSPAEAQASRVKVLWPPAEETLGLGQGLAGQGSDNDGEEDTRIR